jgi:hypothetical protein
MSRRKVKNHWFVSVAVPQQGHGQQFVRRTETFPTEADAKQFAKEMISEKRLRVHYWAFISRYVVLSQARNSIDGLGLRNPTLI